MIIRYLLLLFLLQVTVPDAESQFLKRSLLSAPESENEITTSSAHYKPLFGAGDGNSGIIKGCSRYGLLVIDSAGKCKEAKFMAEEQILFILRGTGNLIAGKTRLPVSKNDFIYIPAGMKYSVANPREQPLKIIMMGFRLTPEGCKSSELMIASTDEVKFQILPSHGPTTQFQLLLGTTESTRDRLAAACRVTSLFIMDFAAGGTNNPHRHDDEEEIYLVLKGNGDIVAGENLEGGESRHPSVEGDVYFYAPKTLIGFYSSNGSDEEHARILAVRFRFP